MATDDPRDYEVDRVERQRQLDETQTFLSDNLPRLWKSLYDGLIREGFSDTQAFSLIKVYVLRDGMYGVHVHKE